MQAIQAPHLRWQRRWRWTSYSHPQPRAAPPSRVTPAVPARVTPAAPPSVLQLALGTTLLSCLGGSSSQELPLAKPVKARTGTACGSRYHSNTDVD